MMSGRTIPLAILVTAGLAAGADAKPRCHEGFQDIGKGRSISTPYCEDLYLAEVAREYGSRVSVETIRNNPNAKRDVCRLIGRDIRINQACVQFQTGRGRF